MTFEGPGLPQEGDIQIILRVFRSADGRAGLSDLLKEWKERDEFCSFLHLVHSGSAYTRGTHTQNVKLYVDRVNELFLRICCYDRCSASRLSPEPRPRRVRGRRRTPYKYIVVPLLSSDEKFLVIGRLRAVL